MINLDFYTIFWREMLEIRKKLWRFIASGLVMPALYLITFGWGLGRGMRVGGGTYLEFVLPGIIALSAMNNSFSGVAVSLNISKLYSKTIEELLVSPISPYSIALGKVFAGCVRGLFSSMLLLLLGLILNVQIHITAMFFAILILTTFIFASFGVIAAMVTKSHEDMTNFNSFFILPMSFLSGTFFSPSGLPEPFSSLIMVYPLTHASLSLRAISQGQPVSAVSLLILCLYALAFFYLAVRAIKNLEI